MTDAVGLRERAAAADLVITGEGAFDFSSRSGKVPYGVAAVAEAAAAALHRPGRTGPGRLARDAGARRSSPAYALVDLVGKERLSPIPREPWRTWPNAWPRTLVACDAGE